MEKNKGGNPQLLTGSRREPVVVTQAPTLAEIGVDKKLSSRSQKLAVIPEKKFEGMNGKTIYNK